MGLYVGTSFMFLWLSFSDFILPVRVAFVTALFFVPGYTSIELGSTIQKKPLDVGRAFFKGVALVAEIVGIIYTYNATSFWIRNIVPIYYMEAMPFEVQLFGTIGLMVTIAFFLSLQYYLFHTRISSLAERTVLLVAMAQYLIIAPMFMLSNPDRALLDEGALSLSLETLGLCLFIIYLTRRIVRVP